LKSDSHLRAQQIRGQGRQSRIETSGPSRAIARS
jgi:hypothetical protein